jgi:hypothetical protein
MNTILFRFCEYIGYAEKLTVLKSLSTELVSDYVFRPIDQIDERLGKEIVNQYLLSNAKRYYWIKDYSYSAYLFKAIDPDYLEPADLAEYKDLKYRSTNAGLLSFLRKVPGLQGLKKILRNG